MKKAILALISVQVLVSTAHAQKRPNDPPGNEKSVIANGVAIGRPTYQGTGCKEGSVSLTLSPDQKVLSVLFDDFAVEAGPAVGSPVAHKMCRLRIPIRVGPGFQVAVVKTDFRGFNDLGPGTEANIRTVHSFRPDRPNLRETRPIIDNLNFQGPLSEEFLTGSHIQSDIPWTPCGQNVSLGIGAQIQVKAPGSESAISAIDSLDVQGSSKGVDYHMFWRRCQ